MILGKLHTIMISLTKNDIFAFALFYIYQCHLQLFSFHVPIQLTQKQMRNPVYMYANMFFYTFVPFPVILYHIYICIYLVRFFFRFYHIILKTFAYYHVVAPLFQRSAAPMDRSKMLSSVWSVLLIVTALW